MRVRLALLCLATQAEGHEEVQWAVLRVLEQISDFDDGAHMLARCAGLREVLKDSTIRHPAMDELARHISSNLPVGVEPVPDVKAPARVAARIKAEELGMAASSLLVCLWP